jgi:hypothetical protein
VRSPHRLTDDLTYKDLVGRRRPRRYILVAMAIFALVACILLLGWRQRGALLRPGAVSPAAEITAGRPAEETAAPATPGATPANRQPAPEVMLPTTPASLALPPAGAQVLAISRDDNFRRIAPPCVYDGLARTVGWDLLRVMGYSAVEAAEALGFDEFPWQPLPEIIDITNNRGPLLIELERVSDEAEKQLSHPDFRVWIVDRGGRPGVTFVLRGCYRAEIGESNGVEGRDAPDPVVCVVSVYPGEWAVLELGSHVYADESLPTRRFAVYGYAGDGLWASLGYQREPFVEIRSPASDLPALLPLTMDLAEIESDRRFTAGLHGLAPWDAAWLEAELGLSMRLLQEDWWDRNDPAAYQAIQGEKEEWAQEGAP